MSELVKSSSRRMSAFQKAQNLQEIRVVCRPEPLAGDQLDAFFVETDLARDPNQRTREQLMAALDVEKDMRLLFYGHGGCGKSTELNMLKKELGNRFLIVGFSALDEMNYISARAEDLILVITERILKTAREARLEVDDKLIEPVLKYFSETTTRTQKGKVFGAGADVGAGGKLSLLTLLNLFTKLQAEIKLEARSEKTTVARLRKSPADLLAQANNVIHAVQTALPEDQRLLIIVEDLDKLDLKQAYEMFVNNVRLLTGVNTSIIYTIPVFLFHSPDVNAFRHHFDDAISQPMINVMNPSNQKEPGFETVRKIILARIEKNLIHDDALDLLVEKTGGVLRHAFEALHIASRVSTAAAPLTADHIQYGLGRLKKEFWSQIALPMEPIPGAPESVVELYDRLTQYALDQKKGAKTIPMADATNQVLLRSCALVEYNGEGWFGVHPLVIDNLKRMGKIS